MTTRSRSSWWRKSGIALASIVFMGVTGTVYDSDGCRYMSTSSKSSTHTISGYTDAWYYQYVCAYQQSQDAHVQAALGCTSVSSTSSFTDGCGVNWYPFTITFTLNSGSSYWFKDNGPEYTRVQLKTNYGVVIHTFTDDGTSGPSNYSNTCFRSFFLENGAQAPITFYYGSVPTGRACGINAGQCIGGSYNGWSCTSDSNCPNGYCWDEADPAGCPFTCNEKEGCDFTYGVQKDLFYDYSSRVNSSSQLTSYTRFDQYGATSGSGVPSGDWYYGTETGTCSGGTNPGALCTSNNYCYGGGYCSAYYVVMRRDYVTSDSLKIRRGQNRRNVMTEAWAKTTNIDANHREFGLVSHFYDADNYFVFMVREYGGDYARLQRYRNGSYGTIAYSYPALNLTSWNKLGFLVRDNGSYTTRGFQPNGTCRMIGYVNDYAVVSTSSTDCLRAPYGQFGLFSYYMRDSQFWNLQAYPCVSGQDKCQTY